MTSYENLEARFRQYNLLNDLRSIVSWDEAVIMPSGAGPARGEGLAELSTLMQKMISSPDVGTWINEARSSAGDLNSWQGANLNEIHRLYIENTAIPSALNQRLVIAQMKAEQQWRQLRSENNWQDFAPIMTELLSIVRDRLQILSERLQTPIYDTALGLYARGLNTAIVDQVFGQLKTILPGMIATAVEKQKSEPVIEPVGKFPMAAQKALGLELMKALGFDLNHGRLDESHHPFCGGNARDVRITTRYSEADFISSLMGVLHETGHALYEQNLPGDWIEQPVGMACGMAIHESQSLLIEMQVVRSREFLEFIAPMVRKHFSAYVSDQAALETENLIRLVSRVVPGLIRVDADEMTYPAHVILRFEIERDLLMNRWPISELPEVWNEKMKAYLSLSTVGDYKNGCMQDVHWPSGGFGYFPSYTFGAIIAAQLFQAAQKSRSGLLAEIGRGEFNGLKGWLKENIWSQGSRYDTLHLVEKAAGPLSLEPYKNHLIKRYLN